MDNELREMLLDIQDQLNNTQQMIKELAEANKENFTNILRANVQLIQKAKDDLSGLIEKKEI